jgi:DNA-binding MurR/RpiR family transcriptional regulator
MLEHPHDVIFATAGELGAAADTSDATVIRTAKALGYSGLPELKRHLGRGLTRRRPPVARLAERIEKTRSSGGSLLDKVFAEGAERIQEAHRQLKHADFEDAVNAITEARSVFSWGLGMSSVVAEYAALRLGRLGLISRFTADTGFRLADALLQVTGAELILMYVPGRHNRDVEAVVSHAERVGADVVLVTHSLGSELGARVRVTLSAAGSPTKFTGELLTASLITDALVLAVAAKTTPRSTATADLLTTLRSELTDHPFA